MLINYMPGEECRIAIVAGGKLEEFYQERASSESHVGNIYKGKVTNVEPSIQAAFVDFGIGKNGFLHVTDLHPMYFPGEGKNTKAPVEQVGSKTPHRERPPIQKALRKGQEVLVQVLKEGIGTKGPTLSSYLSIPGRFLVMMPHMEHHGVSRKVEDEDTRKEMRRILEELNPPDDFGFIVRTAGFGQTKTDLKRDLAYLQRLWKTIERRRKQIKGAGELYAESDLIIRTIRDVFSSDIERIVVDDLTAAQRARDFLAIANPRTKSKVVYYDDPVPLFHRFEIEQQIENINSHTVPLPSGGSLVIEQTEALVAIDVNSGKSRDAQDAETNAYNTNMEAVDEICRQLRLRDLGGVIVNDLIDMRQRKHRRQIEQRMRNNLKNDRARTRTGSLSQFGILEMTRQRMRPSLKSSIYMDCPNCGAPGHVKTPESVALDVMRRLQLVMHRNDVTRIELNISPDVAFHLLNQKRSMLVNLENRFGKRATVRVGSGTLDHVNIEAFDQYGNSLGTDLDITGDRMQAETETTYRDLDDPALAQQAETAPAEADEAEPAGPTQKTEVESALEAANEATEAGEADTGAPRRRKRRRGGRSRRKKSGGQAQGEEGAAGESQAGESSPEPAEPASDADSQAGGDQPSEPDATEGSDEHTQTSEAAGRSSDNGEGQGQGRRRRGRRRGGRRRRRKGGDREQREQPSDQPAADSQTDTAAEPAEQSAGGPKDTQSTKEDDETQASGSAAGESAEPADSPPVDAAPAGDSDEGEPAHEDKRDGDGAADAAGDESPADQTETRERASSQSGAVTGHDESEESDQPERSRAKTSRRTTKKTTKTTKKKKTTGKQSGGKKAGTKKAAKKTAGKKSGRTKSAKQSQTAKDQNQPAGDHDNGGESTPSPESTTAPDASPQESATVGGYSNRVITGETTSPAEGGSDQDPQQDAES